MKLFEIKQKTTTKAVSDVDPAIDSLNRAFADQMQGAQNVPAERKKETPAPSTERDFPELKRASAATTRQRTTDIDMPPEAGEHLSFLQRLGLEDEISDAEAAEIAGLTPSDIEGEVPEPRPPGTDLATIETLPANVNRDISAQTHVQPDWHQVKHLPGYLQQPIRAMGRQLFQTYTATPIEEIQIIANVGGQGPNSAREVNAVTRWLVDKGERYTEGEMDFARSIPGYNTDFKLYKAKGYTFMLVKDFAGRYVYAWPSSDEEGSEGAERRAIAAQPRRLR